MAAQNNPISFAARNKYWLIVILLVLGYRIYTDKKEATNSLASAGEKIVMTGLINPGDGAGAYFDLPSDKNIRLCVHNNTGTSVILQRKGRKPVFIRIEKKEDCGEVSLGAGTYVVSLNSNGSPATANISVIAK